MATRQQMWDQLGESVDVLIIGGGINGAGIARDAAMRGLSVALVEMKDLAYGTSSRSSKLVHGGLRYLEQLEFSLVFESVSERRILLDIAPHLVQPLGFLFPVYKSSPRKLTTINAGMWLYEGLSLFRSPKRPRKLRVRDIVQEEPCLTTENLKGAPLYYDCSTDDARLTLENAIDAIERDATVVTWARAVSFLKDEDGRISGAVIKDAFSGELREVKAGVVINATGPWTDRTRSMSSEQPNPLLRPTKGVHIVVDHEKLPVQHAIVCFHPTDERVLFAIPWGNQTYLGTTDTDFKGDPGNAIATRSDVDYLLSAAAAYFPACPLTHDDIIATWAGLRPLMSENDGASDGLSESSVSREHQIIVSPDGLITIAGGKLTTYRRMSAEVVDTAIKFLRLTGNLKTDLKAAHTESTPLPGAVGWPEDDNLTTTIAKVVKTSGNHLTEESARHLVFTYGMRSLKLAKIIAANPQLAEPIIPGRYEVMAQIDWAVTQEMCTTLTDMLIQRTQIFYRDTNQGLDAVDRVANRLAELLGWDEATRLHNIQQYQHDVKLSRQWQTEVPSQTT